MERSDFLSFGYIGGCPGCVHLQAGLTGSRNHSEVCRSRIEACVEDTPEGRYRKDRAAQRREDQLTRELKRQDEIRIKTVDIEAITAAGQDVSEGGRTR